MLLIKYWIVNTTLNEASGFEPGWVDIIPRNLVTLHDRTWLYSLHTEIKNFSDKLTYNQSVAKTKPKKKEKKLIQINSGAEGQENDVLVIPLLQDFDELYMIETIVVHGQRFLDVVQ